VTQDEPIIADGIVAKSARMQSVVDLARGWLRSTRPCSSPVRAGPEKNSSPGSCTTSRRATAGPFIAVNCGAITETLLESELFGHVRGAFTGATTDRPGLFEAANRGTLLLDEVGEVSPGMQVKLLRVLQEREIRRVGENKSRKVDVRIIAATNRDLSHGVAGGAFRQDLYYRLKVVELHVPPLRERREDLLPLARLLLAQAARRMDRKVSGLSPAAAELVLRYEWPGNVRELENAMERAVALTRGARVEIDVLPEELRTSVSRPASTAAVVRPLEEVEKEYILAALALNGGNQHPHRGPAPHRLGDAVPQAQGLDTLSASRRPRSAATVVETIRPSSSWSMEASVMRMRERAASGVRNWGVVVIGGPRRQVEAYGERARRARTTGGRERSLRSQHGAWSGG
jgi:two-component system response regulator HydG